MRSATVVRSLKAYMALRLGYGSVNTDLLFCGIHHSNLAQRTVPLPYGVLAHPIGKLDRLLPER